MKVSNTAEKSLSIFFVFLFLIISLLSINKAKASIFTNIINLFTKASSSASAQTVRKVITSEDLLKPNPVHTSTPEEESAEEIIVNDDGTLEVHSGTLRTSTEKEKVTDGTISLYEVKEGDTISTVAKLFGVSVNNIVWANSLKSKTIKEGQTLLIFPVNGVQYTIKGNATVYDVAEKYKADANEIAEYNGISVEAKLAKGDTLFIPDAEAEIAEPKKTKNKTSTKVVSRTPKFKNNATVGYFMKPISGCMKSQGLHGPYTTAVDYACKPGTNVVAAAKGTVIKAVSSGYNGGYGQVVIISHPNGTQSIYAHLSSVDVANGQKVTQGQVIGATGNTGRSTGPHLHFETRGTSNPF